MHCALRSFLPVVALLLFVSLTTGCGWDAGRGFHGRQVADEVRRKRQLRELVTQVQQETKSKERLAEKPPHWWMLHPQETRHQVSASRLSPLQLTGDGHKRLSSEPRVGARAWSLARTDGHSEVGLGVRQCWDVLMAVALIYTLLVQPFRICFLPPGFANMYELGYWLEHIVNIVFYLDMLVNCITGIYVPKVLCAGVLWALGTRDQPVSAANLEFQGVPLKELKSSWRGCL
jgi:hypothetical protein